MFDIFWMCHSSGGTAKIFRDKWFRLKFGGWVDVVLLGILMEKKIATIPNTV